MDNLSELLNASMVALKALNTCNDMHELNRSEEGDTEFGYVFDSLLVCEASNQLSIALQRFGIDVETFLNAQ